MSRFVRTAIITSIVSMTCFGMSRSTAAPPARIFTPPAFHGMPSVGIGGIGPVGMASLHALNATGPFALTRGIGRFENRLLGSHAAMLRNGFGGMSPYALASYLGGGYGGGYGGYGGGYGGTMTSPYSTNYGAWITSAPTNDSSDYIALSQAAIANRFMNEDLKAKKLQHRRAVFDEMRYEAENTPSLEEVREEMRLQQLMRARNSPPESELVTGVPLNVLLDSVQRMQARENLIGYAIPLDQETLKHINVTTSSNSKASNEFFKPGSLPDWPISFDNDAFTADKKRFSEALFTMGKAQLEGKVNSAKAADARKALANMRDNLFLLRFSISSNDYIDGLTYLSKLGDTVEILAKPDAKKFLDGTYSAKGETVGDLLAYMTGKGLKFARATPGSEASYAALYQALATYEMGLSKLASKR